MARCGSPKPSTKTKGTHEQKAEGRWEEQRREKRWEEWEERWVRRDEKEKDEKDEEKWTKWQKKICNTLDWSCVGVRDPRERQNRERVLWLPSYPAIAGRCSRCLSGEGWACESPESGGPGGPSPMSMLVHPWERFSWTPCLRSAFGSLKNTISREAWRSLLHLESGGHTREAH